MIIMKIIDKEDAKKRIFGKEINKQDYEVVMRCISTGKYQVKEEEKN